jgi:hypothetical protein
VSWLRDGEVVSIGATVAGEGGGRQQLRYEGGTVDQPSLTIRAAAREDIGSYTCRLGEIPLKGMSHERTIFCIAKIGFSKIVETPSTSEIIL